MNDSIELKNFGNVEEVREALKAKTHSLTIDGHTAFKNVEADVLNLALQGLGNIDRPFKVTDREVLKDLILKDARFAKYASDTFKDDNEICVFVVENCPQALEFLSQRINNIVIEFKNQILKEMLIKVDITKFNNIRGI